MCTNWRKVALNQANLMKAALREAEEELGLFTGMIVDGPRS